MALLLVMGLVLVLMIIRPRLVTFFLGGVAVFIVAMFAYVQYQAAQTVRERSLVTAEAEVNRDQCPDSGHPVAVTIFNAGESELNEVSFELLARAVGSTGTLHSQLQRQRLIVPAQGERVSCWGVDSYSLRNLDPAALVWSVSVVSVSFR